MTKRPDIFQEGELVCLAVYNSFGQPSSEPLSNHFFIANGSCDVGICTGGFIRGYIPISSLQEFLKIAQELNEPQEELGEC